MTGKKYEETRKNLQNDDLYTVSKNVNKIHLNRLKVRTIFLMSSRSSQGGKSCIP